MVCLSTADWDAELWTNKQHLMDRLSRRGACVLYVDSLGLRAPGASRRDLTRMARRLGAWRPFARSLRPGLLRDSPLVLPVHGSRVARELNERLLVARLRRNQRRWRLEKPLIWAYAPIAGRLYNPSHHRALVYHCVDDLAAYPGVDADSFGREERLLIARADVCIGSSRPLVEHLRARGAQRVVYWPNPANTTAFLSTPRRAGEGRRPTLGFVGAVQEAKVDLELLTECARRRPNWDFHLVGPVDLGMRSSSVRWDQLPANLRLRGPVEPDALPKTLARFDVGIIPYRINGYTQGVFPMKVFEYLSAGLPVVSTPLPSLVGEVEHVRFATDAGAFIAEAEAALASPSANAEAARRSYAQGFSWENRVAEAEALMQSLPLHR